MPEAGQFFPRHVPSGIRHLETGNRTEHCHVIAKRMLRET